jgi:alpha-1,6-mannosyltransferase
MVAPDAGGAADLVRPAWGEIYRAGDAAACAEAIRRLLARERRVLSEASRGAAKTRIDTPEQHFATLFNHYAEVYAAKQGGMGGQKAAVALG